MHPKCAKGKHQWPDMIVGSPARLPCGRGCGATKPLSEFKRRPLPAGGYDDLVWALVTAVGIVALIVVLT